MLTSTGKLNATSQFWIPAYVGMTLIMDFNIPKKLHIHESAHEEQRQCTQDDN